MPSTARNFFYIGSVAAATQLPANSASVEQTQEGAVDLLPVALRRAQIPHGSCPRW
jgi:hypothetical protein